MFKPSVGSLMTFNIDDGYVGDAVHCFLMGSIGSFLEAEVRGYRSCFLSRADYSNLSQCDTLDGAWSGWA
jgi:hypothetical protein